MAGSSRASVANHCFILDDAVRENTFLHVCRYLEHAAGVAAVDHSHLGGRFPGNEMLDRNEAVGGIDAQPLDLIKMAVSARVTYPDINFVIDIMRPVGSKLESIGNKLNGVAYQGDIGAESASFNSIHVDHPFEAGNGPRIIDILYSGKRFELLPYFRQGRFDQFGKAGGELNLNGFASGGAMLFFAFLDDDSG